MWTWLIRQIVGIQESAAWGVAKGVVDGTATSDQFIVKNITPDTHRVMTVSMENPAVGMAQ